MDDEQELWDLITPTIPRLLHSGDEWQGQPYLYLDDTMAEIGAGTNDRHDKGIAVTSEFGTQITGPMSFSEMPEHISLGGGYWRLNPMLLTCIGSSAALPIPTLVKGTPNLTKSSKDMTDLGAAIGI
jgi:hypothetical protein